MHGTVTRGHIQRKWSKRMTLGNVTLYGRKGDVAPQILQILDIGKKLGATATHMLRPPATSTGLGFHEVTDTFAPNGVLTYAEGGVLIEAGHCLMIPSRDCPIVTIENLENRHLGATHAGRESLINRTGCCGFENVVQALLHKLRVLDGSNVRAFISGGISAKHFPHREAWQVAPFAKRYGSHVITNKKRRTLHLERVIRAILHEWGVPDKNILCDNLCTFTEPGLGSRRHTEKPEQNWTFIHRTR